MPERRVTLGEKKTGKWVEEVLSEPIKPNTYYEFHYKLPKRPWIIETIADWLNRIRRKSLEDVAIDTVKKIREDLAEKLGTKPENIIVNWFMYDDDAKNLKMQLIWMEKPTVGIGPLTLAAIIAVIAGVIWTLYLVKPYVERALRLIEEGVPPEEVVKPIVLPIEKFTRGVLYIIIAGTGAYLLTKVLPPIIKAKFSKKKIESPEKKTGG